MERKIVTTHSGGFHADDVFAVATLSLVLDENIEIVRTRDDKKIEESDYVVDVGGTYNPSQNRFDHHQEGGAGERENGIPYAAFGLVWKEYGEQLTGSKEVQEHIDTTFIQPIDATDNGVSIASPVFEGIYPNSVNSIVGTFRPTWKEEQTDELYLERFTQLVEAATTYLAQLIHSTQSLFEAQKHVEDAYTHAADKRLIILNANYPWFTVLREYTEPLFVIKPRTDGNWALETVQDEHFVSRKPLPEEWAGKRDEELQSITGVDGAIFCHNKRFLVVAQTEEDILKLAEQALEN